MGKPSSKRYNARRLGRRERARVKRHRRGSFSSYAAGVGHVHVIAGRKKMDRAWRWIGKLLSVAPIKGEPSTPKVQGEKQTASL